PGRLPPRRRNTISICPRRCAILDTSLIEHICYGMTTAGWQHDIAVHWEFVWTTCAAAVAAGRAPASRAGGRGCCGRAARGEEAAGWTRHHARVVAVAVGVLTEDEGGPG